MAIYLFQVTHRLSYRCINYTRHYEHYSKYVPLDTVGARRLHRKALLLIALSVPATLNKETYLFFLPTLSPVLRSRLGGQRSLLLLSVLMALSVATNLLVRNIFHESTGDAAEFHLLGNLLHYLQPWAYREIDSTYGVVGPGGASFLTLAIVAVICARGWNFCTIDINQHMPLACAVNFPLLLAFGATGELRNLSFLIIGLMILSAHTMAQAHQAQHIP